jgi:hypothetical protein
MPDIKQNMATYCGVGLTIEFLIFVSENSVCILPDNRYH